MPLADTLFVKDANGATLEVRALPAVFPVTGAFWQATQPVSLAANTPDVTDRAARLLGHVTVDNPSLAVTGTFWQATQPISAVALPLPSGASTEATLALIKAKTDNLDVLLSTRTKPADAQHVTIDNASLAVTGTFFQATQPVSLASVPTHGVTGTFWQATQPVSGTFWQATQPVSIAAMPSTPVTGAFFQATQPVSLATNTPDVTDRTARLLGHVTVDNASFAVTGTFFQATQPVSIASMPSTPVTGSFWQATQPVSIASMPSTPVTGTFWQATQPVSGPLTDAQLRASAVPVSGFPAWPYPTAVTRIAQQSAVAANAQATATLAAAANKTTYITNLQIFATGATAAGAVNVTITGLLGGTMTIPFDVPAGVNVRATPIILDFATPLPGSAVNTAIVVTLPALGSGNTRATVNAQGVQQ